MWHSARSERRWPRLRTQTYVSFTEFQPGLCLYVTAAVKGGSLGTCRDLRVMSSSPPNPVPPAMSPSPTGLAPMEGIPMVAQAVLHREILHVHASLDLILTILRTRLAILSRPLLGASDLSPPSSTTSWFGFRYSTGDAGHPHRFALHS